MFGEPFRNGRDARRWSSVAIDGGVLGSRMRRHHDSKATPTSDRWSSIERFDRAPFNPSSMYLQARTTQNVRSLGSRRSAARREPSGELVGGLPNERTLFVG